MNGENKPYNANIDEFDVLPEFDEKVSQSGEYQQNTGIANVTKPTEFSKEVDKAKISVLHEASTDEQFVGDFKKKLKDATMKLAEVEQEKASLEKQNINYQQELLEKEQELNAQRKAENFWENRKKRREYHFDGVRPLMEFVGIKSAMNLVLLYILTFVLTPFFLLSKLWNATIGAVISGAGDANRPKAMKGFLWTIIAIFTLSAFAAAGYLFLKWQGLI